MLRACIIREINNLKSLLKPDVLTAPVIAYKHLVQEEQKVANAPINIENFQRLYSLLR